LGKVLLSVFPVKLPRLGRYADRENRVVESSTFNKASVADLPSLLYVATILTISVSRRDNTVSEDL
jgi:hypothetical protein